MESIVTSNLQSSSDYPAPDTPAIPIQRHFFEMIRSEKKKVQVQVPSVQWFKCFSARCY